MSFSIRYTRENCAFAGGRVCAGVAACLVVRALGRQKMCDKHWDIVKRGVTRNYTFTH